MHKLILTIELPTDHSIAPPHIRTAQHRHEFGSQIAKVLQNHLYWVYNLSQADAFVGFDIQAPDGHSEGPDE